MVDESQKLCGELKRLEVELTKARQRKIELFNDPDTLSLITRAVAAEKLFDASDPDLIKLQGEVQRKRQEIREEEAALMAKEKEIRRELRKATEGEIALAIETLNRELSPLKVQRRVIEQLRGGFDMTLRVKVESNEDGVAEIRKLVLEGRKILSGMNFEPIQKIRAFADETVRKIRAVDLSPKQKIMDGLDNERQEFITAPLS